MTAACAFRFWDDPTLTELAVRITAIAGAEVRVDQTIFYAQSGGQESDHGTLGGIYVIEARKQAHADGTPGIVYTLATAPAWQVGETVTMRIDGARRHRLMRLHFAAEVVLELVYRACAGIEKIGAHIGPDKARIDFLWPQTLAPLLPTVQAQAMAIIDADQPIVSAFSDAATLRRYWEVEGFARVPCGGTHLKRTGEVGTIALKRKNVGGGKERVEITLA